MAMHSSPDEDIPVRTHVPTAILGVLVALGMTAMALAGPSAPPIGPTTGLGVPTNGDLALGLDGWGRIGPTMALRAGPLIEAADNTTVLSPAFTVPMGSQSLPIVVGIPGANAVVEFRARPVSGGADIPLATITPTRGLRRWDVPIASLVGQTVRIVIDPVTSLGRRLLVASVGPVESVLPGWVVHTGLPVVTTTWGRHGIRTGDSRLTMSTPSTAVAPGTRYLGLVVRGSGTVSAVIESNRVSVRATGNRWTPIHVAVPEHTRSVVVLVDATPGDGQVLVVADVGVAVRTTRITHAVATAMADGGGSVVRARVTPDAAGIIVRLRVGAHFIGTGRVRADGRVVVRSPRTGVPATLVTTGDASHLPARVALTLPG